MFDNIGEKIKVVAVLSTLIGILGSIISGIVLIAEGELIGLLPLLAGPLLSWIGSFILYGFGELIDLTQQVANNTRHLPPTAAPLSSRTPATVTNNTRHLPSHTASPLSSSTPAGKSHENTSSERASLRAPIKCPDCRNVVSSYDVSCAYCGYLLLKNEEKPRKFGKFF